jgi:undecaprenyl-diphosphatase
MGLNQAIFNLIHGLAGRNRLIDLLGIFFSDYFGYLLLAAVLYLIFSQKDWRKRYRDFLFVALTAILSRGLFTEIIRFFYNHPRPFVALGFNPLVTKDITPSFPSGHAAFYFALVIPVFYLISRKWGWYLLGGAFLLGLARIFVGVHWPLDILGSLLVAAASFYIVKILFKKIRS